MEDEKLKQIIEYFRKKGVYQKLFKKMQSKYESLGHIGGTVTLTGLTIEEKEQLGGFLQKNYRGNQSVTVSTTVFQQAINQSRFAGVMLEEILAAYFDSPLIGKKEQARQAAEEKDQFFNMLLAQWGQLKTAEKSDDAAAWLRQILTEPQEGYWIVMRQYKEDKHQLTVILNRLLAASRQLPRMTETVEQLPVFAAKVTGDPHWFDQRTISGRLLIIYLIWKYQMVREIGLAESEWTSNVLFCAGILKDALSNMTLVYGVCGRDKTGIHAGIEGFYQRREPLYLTLKTLGELTDLWIGMDQKMVYVVENPAVFSAIIQAVPSVCAVCSNGQPRLATLVLLDFLSKYGQLWYAGDFDPEGLEIAQRLKQRYGERLALWCYRKEYYDRYRLKELLSPERLKKLEKIHIAELIEIKEKLLEVKCAAYQERMIDIYTREIKRQL